MNMSIKNGINARELFLSIKNKYNLQEGIEDLFVADEFCKIWYEKTNRVKEKSVAVYGAGGNTAILLNMLYKWEEEQKISVVIDNNTSEKTIDGIPIIKLDDLRDYSIDLVWISSWEFGDEMITSVANMYPEMECFNPYDSLKKRFGKTEVSDIASYVSFNKYKWFSKKLIERELCNDENKVKTISQQLISGYFCIYDWVSLRCEIEEYIKKRYDGFQRYENLLDDTENMLNVLFEELENKRCKSTVIYVIDALSKYVAKEMPGLTSWKRDGLEYTEYRNEYPTTHEFFLSMFTGWRPFENQTYMGKNINHDSSDLLSFLSNHEIDIKVLSQNSKISRDFREVNKYENKIYENALMSEVFFNGMCELLKDNKEQIVVIHTDVTIHAPHLTPITKYVPYEKVEDSRSEYKKNFDIAVKYTDDILSFYTKILDKNKLTTQIIMGDHGINVGLEYACRVAYEEYENKGAQWNKPMISPELIIRGITIGSGVNDNLISSNRFVDILFSIIKGEDPNETIRGEDVVPIEIVPGYDMPWLMLGVKSHNYYLPIGGAGCMSKEYIFVSLESGEEFYYQIMDERIVLIEDDEIKENAIVDLGTDRIMTSKFPMEILEQSFFDKHNEIYSRRDIDW